MLFPYRLRHAMLVRRVERDTRACIACSYLTPVEDEALIIERDYPHKSSAEIGRSLAMSEELTADLLASAHGKLADRAPRGADSLRRQRRMARNQTRWVMTLIRERARRGLPPLETPR
jgi:hypothetical protein